MCKYDQYSVSNSEMKQFFGPPEKLGFWTYDSCIFGRRYKHFSASKKISRFNVLDFHSTTRTTSQKKIDQF